MAAASTDAAETSLGDAVFPTPRSMPTHNRPPTRGCGTSMAQPALAAASLAQLALLDRLGLTPAAVAGHSW